MRTGTACTKPSTSKAPNRSSGWLQATTSPQVHQTDMANQGSLSRVPLLAIEAVRAMDSHGMALSLYTAPGRSWGPWMSPLAFRNAACRCFSRFSVLCLKLGCHNRSVRKHEIHYRAWGKSEICEKIFANLKTRALPGAWGRDLNGHEILDPWVLPKDTASNMPLARHRRSFSLFTVARAAEPIHFGTLQDQDGERILGS